MMTGALYVKSEDMVFEQMQGESGGSASVCQLVGPEISKTIDAGIATYDGCSIERKVSYDETIVVLGGLFRLLTGENYGRVIEAKFGDVIWLTKGTRLKYQGDKAKVFYARHPVDWRTRSEATEDDKPLNDVYHFRSTDMIYSQMQIYSGGYASTCSLVTPDISKSLGATIATFNGSSVDWTTEYDQISVALGGVMRIRTGENYSQEIDARLGDVVWLPKGTALKYEGERGIMFFVPYPVDGVCEVSRVGRSRGPRQFDKSCPMSLWQLSRAMLSFQSTMPSLGLRSFRMLVPSRGEVQRS